MTMKRLLLYCFLLCSLCLVAQDTVVVQDTTALLDTLVMQDTAVVSDIAISPRHDHLWRSVRSTRTAIRQELRDTRVAYRSEMLSLRDSVRADIYSNIDSLPHELRVGWGDQLFEMLVWHASDYPTILPEDYTAVYNENFRYMQHSFMEYMYNISYGYSIGGLVDFSGVLWDKVERNGQGKELQREEHMYCNIVLMPVVRFSYYHSEYVSLYSALGVGLNINYSTELDYKGRVIAVAPAANISLLGVRVGKGRCYGAVEFGGMISLVGSNEVYMLGSRLFTASIGVQL